jgi:hypothetical protein
MKLHHVIVRILKPYSQTSEVPTSTPFLSRSYRRRADRLTLELEVMPSSCQYLCSLSCGLSAGRREDMSVFYGWMREVRKGVSWPV